MSCFHTIGGGAIRRYFHLGRLKDVFGYYITVFQYFATIATHGIFFAAVLIIILKKLMITSRTEQRGLKGLSEKEESL